MKGLALAEQVEVQLVARVTLDALGDELAARDAKWIEDRLRDNQTQNRQEDQEELLGGPIGLEHLIEGRASQRRDSGDNHRGEQRAQKEGGEPALVTQDVRDDPADGAAPVVDAFAGDGELALCDRQSLDRHQRIPST